MHLRVRFFGKPDTLVVVESKLTKIEQVRKIIEDKFEVDAKLQRLFYGGKLLEDGYTLHDYNIKLNDVIQLMVKVEPVENKTQKDANSENKYKETQSSLYQVGDLIDVKDRETGAWFEGKLIKIVLDPKLKYESQEEGVTTQTTNDEENKPPKNIKKSPKRGIETFFKQSKGKNIMDGVKKTDENILYQVQMDYDEEADSDLFCNIKEIRPRARKELDIEGLKAEETVMVNFNTDNPSEKGHWYDFKVNEVKNIRTRYELVGTLYLGQDSVPLNDTVIKIHDKIFAIEQPVPLVERSPEYYKLLEQIPERSKALKCLKCRDNDNLACRECGCYECGGKENPEKIVLCDECNNGYHMKCLTPPLTELPEDDWYCPSCKRDTNEVVAPGAAKQTEKTSASKTNRDWGRGMACVGKTKTCAMPANHFGPIPGIEVGMCWRFRIQLSESGVHRPPVSGIHGRDVEGAYSIVLSGGYEDDVDNGKEFTYTGSGGRDLAGNKRTAEQSCDQTLTRENKALARNCAVKEVSEKGGDAGKEWRQGKPVRVVRSYKMMKHFPKYAPKEGIRYDGIYKVVKYYPEKGLSGYRVWKYLLRRDDPSPAPWESGAKHFPIVYPDGYLEAEAEKKALREKSAKGKGKKRPLREDNNTSDDLRNETSPAAKKQKLQKLEAVAGKKLLKEKSAEEKGKKKPLREDNNTSDELRKETSPPLKIQNSHTDTPKVIPSMFKKSPKNQNKLDELSAEEKQAIKSDTLNNKLWGECLDVCKNYGKKQFIDQVTEGFLCIICQDVAVNPVTTPCLHNFCMGCIKIAFKTTESQTCPCCRNCLTEYEPSVNDNLKTALRTILAGYDAGKK